MINVGTQDRWLQPKTTLGQLHVVQSLVPACPVQFQVQENEHEQVATVQSVQVESDPSLDFSQLSWSTLSHWQKEEARTLLKKYQCTFSCGDGDLGCTDLLQHTIPLLDEVPVRQRYRRLPPSQYDLVKSHIQELVFQGVASPSCSPYASPIVVVKKRWLNSVMCRLSAAKCKDPQGCLPLAVNRRELRCT